MSGYCCVCSTESTNLTSLSNAHDNLENARLLETIRVCGGILFDKTKEKTLLICNKCIDNARIAYKFHQTCQNLTDQVQLHTRKRSKSKYQDASTQTIAPKLTLIINNITRKINTKDLDTLFYRYGTISDIYLCPFQSSEGKESFARITFCDERGCLKAYKATESGELKLNGDSLAITRVSDYHSPIDVLTDDCLQRIFMLISSNERLALENVCSRWSRIAPLSWTNVTKLDSPYVCYLDGQDRFEDILIRCGKFLTDVCVDLADRPVERLTLLQNYCRNIRNFEINFNYEEPTNELVQYLDPLLIQNEKLLRIRLRGIDDDFNFNFSNNLSENIIEIHVWVKNCYLTPRNSSLDLSKFRDLKVLSLEFLELNGENDLRGLESLNQLRHLRFSNTAIHSNAIEKIQNFRNLERLEIPELDINDDVLFETVTNNHGIKFLDISGILDISEQTFQYIVQLPNLESLIMKDLHDINGCHLTHLTQIKLLNCKGCSSITDWELMSLIELAPGIEMINTVGCSVTVRLIVSAEESMKHRDHCLSIYVSNSEVISIWEKLPTKSGKLEVNERSPGFEVYYENAGWGTVDKV